MGVFEIGRFAQGTIAVAKALSSRTDEVRTRVRVGPASRLLTVRAQGAITIVGGGDSVAALSHLSPPPNVRHARTRARLRRRANAGHAAD